MGVNYSSGVDNSGPTSARPTGADVGDTYLDTTLNALFVWTGSTWLQAGGVGLVDGALTIENSTTDGDTSLVVQNNGTGAATFSVTDTNGPAILTFDADGGLQVTGVGSSFDAGAFGSDGEGNVAMNTLQASTSVGTPLLQINNFLNVAPQNISTTGSTSVNSSNIICSGSTTAPKLPAPTNGTIIFLKNAGSGNCVIAADSGSDIVAAGGTSTASSLTIATGHSTLLVADGTHWNQIV